MSKYAIYRRRGTAPATAAVVAPRTITTVTDLGGGTVAVDFDAPITYSGTGGLGGFNIGGLGSTGGIQTGPARITLVPDAAFAPFDPWDLVNSPPEITEPVTFPDAGVIA